MLNRVVMLSSDPRRAEQLRACMVELVQEAVYAEEAPHLLQLLQQAPADLILFCQDDWPQRSTSLLERTLSICPEAAVVVVAEKPDVQAAVRCVRAGATDYFTGPADAEHLGRLIRGLQSERGAAGASRERFFCAACPPGVPIVGRSEATVRMLEMIRVVSESRCNPILILGETGTGKELAARAVHAWRCGRPDSFVAVNCAALTANLLESELFGHVKGAFTGADREKTGLFEAAGDGTIFLDEISEMPPALQAKLLRVLQERCFRKVGGTRDVPCSATVVASSNRELKKAVDEGDFRKDLYYRLAVFPIQIRPLRDERRTEDIPLLAEYFLSVSDISDGKEIDGFSPEAMQRLSAHNYPGNVRELRNVVDRAILLEQGGRIGLESLHLDDTEPADGCGQDDPESRFSLKAAEREMIIRALRETGGQRTRAAAMLGITRATLHAKLKRYDISERDVASPSGA